MIGLRSDKNILGKEWGLKNQKVADLWHIVSENGATSVDMTKHFYDIRLHDLIYMTSIYVTQLLHDTWFHEKHLHDKSNEYMTEQNHDTH